MVEMKKISIIIPCYNVDKYVDQCVESLISQTMDLEMMELIFVDDASSDNTVKRLEKWEKRYPDSIMIICCEQNGRQGTARNIGLNYASGEYIGFVDADDYVDRSMFQKLYDIAIKEDCQVVCGLFDRVMEDGSVAIEAEKRTNAGRKICIHDRKGRVALMQSGLPGGVWSGIYRRKFILENELFFPEKLLYEDNYWGAFLLQDISNYYILNEVLYHYVVHNDSTIMKGNSLHHLDRLVIELMKVEEYKKRGLFDDYYDEIESGFIKMYFINTIRILFVRFDKIPYDVIYMMQQNVKELFPHYQRNPYLRQLPQLQRELLKIVEVPLNPERIDILANAYREVLIKENGGIK